MRFSIPNQNQNQNGLTLIEMMIAMVLGLILIAGIGQIFISSKQAYRLTEAQSRIQENGRFALYMLTSDIRMADFWGCLTSNSASIQNHLADTTGIYNFADGLTATNNLGLNGSDTITLKGAFNNGVHVASVMPTTSATVEVSDNSGLLENEIILISDCLQGEIFQITNDPSTGAAGAKDQVVHNTGAAGQIPGNATKIFQVKYGLDATVYKLGTKKYFIAAGASGEPALFITNSGVTSELVEGVENMQILYGEDTDGDLTPNYYVDSDTVVDMEKVVSVKVSLLLHSMEDNVTSSNLGVTYNGATSTIANRRLGRVFSSTITIRNRMQ